MLEFIAILLLASGRFCLILFAFSIGAYFGGYLFHKGFDDAEKDKKEGAKDGK